LPSHPQLLVGHAVDETVDVDLARAQLVPNEVQVLAVDAETRQLVQGVALMLDGAGEDLGSEGGQSGAFSALLGRQGMQDLDVAILLEEGVELGRVSVDRLASSASAISFK
jgi:hypothetical protein